MDRSQTDTVIELKFSFGQWHKHHEHMFIHVDTHKHTYTHTRCENIWLETPLKYLPEIDSNLFIFLRVKNVVRAYLLLQVNNLEIL